MDEQIPDLPEKEEGELLTINGDLDFILKKPCMFERSKNFFVVYCLCYVKETSIDMLDGHILEERYTDLNEEEDIRMEYSREEHWRIVDEDGEDKSNAHTLRWDVYTIEEEDLIKICFWCPFRIQKGKTLFGLV